MNQNQRGTEANALPFLNHRHIMPFTLCHGCGKIIKDQLPINIIQNGEESLPDRYTCVAIFVSGLDGIYLTFCHKCHENFETGSLSRRNNRMIVDERGDHERLLVSLKCFPINMSIGDGLNNRAPYIVNVSHMEGN